MASPDLQPQQQQVDNAVPSEAQIAKAAKVEIFNGEGESKPFGSLFEDQEDEDHSANDGKVEKQQPRRHLVVFIRHFFCGLCQDYTVSLNAQIPPSSLPPNTSISIIGCGDPQLIATYIANTSCQYPIYADPSQQLYSHFGMTKSLGLGDRRPDYQSNGMLNIIWKGIYQTLASGAGMMFKGGPHNQLGGEMLFEIDAAAGEDGELKVAWCHRMTTTRNHVEVSEIKRLLGLNSD